MQKMEKFLDSTSVRDDGHALTERLDREGYLFIRQLLPRDAVVQVRTRLLKKAAEGGWLEDNSLIESGIANQDAACKDPEPGRRVQPTWESTRLALRQTRLSIRAARGGVTLIASSG